MLTILVQIVNMVLISYLYLLRLEQIASLVLKLEIVLNVTKLTITNAQFARMATILQHQDNARFVMQTAPHAKAQLYALVVLVDLL